MTLFTYTVSRDYGFAPNPFWGVCTLSCCKPRVRQSAKVGDLIIGIGGTANNLTGKIIYAMVVEEIMGFRDYWNDPRFQMKKPNLLGSHKGFFGDNIYFWDEEARVYSQVNSHHSNPDGTTSLHNLTKDTGADQVLVSRDYVYFGAEAVTPPSDLCDGLPDRFPRWSRDFCKNYSCELRSRVEAWLRETFEWGLRGLPERWSNAIEGQKH